MSHASLGMPMPPRAKRSALLKAYVPQSLREFYEGQLASHPQKSLSDVVYEALEDQAAMRIAKQKLGSRALDL